MYKQFGEVQAIYSFYSVPVAIAWGAENSNCPMEKVENAMIGYVRCYSVASQLQTHPFLPHQSWDSANSIFPLPDGQQGGSAEHSKAGEAHLPGSGVGPAAFPTAEAGRRHLRQVSVWCSTPLTVPGSDSSPAAPFLSL